jgi:hypothetical protein
MLGSGAMTLAHVGPLPVEELLPAVPAAGTALWAALATLRRRGRRR